MKKYFSVGLFVAMVFSGGAISRASSDDESGMNVNGSVEVLSADVDVLSGEKISSKIFIHPMVVAEYGDFYASMEIGAVDDQDRNFSQNPLNSIGISIGTVQNIAEISVDMGVGFSDYQNSSGDMAYVYMTAEKKLENDMIPYITLEQDISMDRKVVDGGLLWRTGARKSIAIGQQEVLVDLSLGGHNGAYDYDPQAISSAKLSISMEVECVGVVLAPEVNVQKNLHDDGIASDAIWIGIKFSF